MKLKYLALAIVASFTLSACIATQTNQNSTAQSAAVETNTNKVFSQNYVFKELENGLRVLIVKTDYPDLVSVQIPVSVGSRDEDEVGRTGFAHFFNV